MLVYKNVSILLYPWKWTDRKIIFTIIQAVVKGI